MIGTTDIANLLYKACTKKGIEVYQYGNIPRGEVTTPRVTIHVKSGSDETWWRKGFAEVNFNIPDLEDGTADLITLGEYERDAWKLLKFTDVFDDTTFQFKVSSTEVMQDTQFKCHYVNARVLYRVINVIN